jgi:hypothetical protein
MSVKKKQIKKTTKPKTSKSKTWDQELVYSKASDIVFRPTVEGALGILKLDQTSSYYTVNAWAAEIFRLIDGKKNIKKILATIEARSKLDAKIVQKQAKSVFNLLKKNSLITLN